MRRACINYAVAAIFSLAVPAGAQTRADTLLDELASAPAERSAALESQLIDHWSQSGSATLDMLLSRGRAAIDTGDASAAIGHLTAAIDHGPDFAQAYASRAEAYVMAGRPGPAVEDLRRALQLEPRHIDAIAGLAVLLAEIGQPERARTVLQELLRLSPHSENAALVQQMLDDASGAKDA